jgi:hypothetical protein
MSNLNFRIQSGFILGPCLSIFCGVPLILNPILSTELTKTYPSLINKYKGIPILFISVTVSFLDDFFLTELTDQNSRLSASEVKKIQKSYSLGTSALRIIMIENWLKDMRVNSEIISQFTSLMSETLKLSDNCLISPLATLPEFGGSILASRKLNSKPQVLNLSRSDLKENVVKLIPVSMNEEDLKLTDFGELFFNCAAIVVDPRNKKILGEKYVGEIWLKSNYTPKSIFDDEEKSLSLLKAKYFGTCCHIIFRSKNQR